MFSRKYPHLAHPKYRPDIDGLRAVAILPVVIYHAFPNVIPGGFIGVDIFFVISGFLISTIIFSSLEHDRFSLVEFYVRRIRRIFPALILVLAACLTLGWFVLIADQYQQLSKHVSAGAIFIQNFTLLHEIGYFDNSAETKPLLHLWSLAIEEQFYIIWPLLLAFIWKRHWSFLHITVAITAISFLSNLYLTNSNLMTAFYSPFSRFWEIMAGGVLAYTTLHHPDLLIRNKNVQSILGFILILLGFFFLNMERQFPGWWALLPTLGALFVISSGTNAWLNKILLTNKPMIWIGLISYPLYLWHWPLLSFLHILDTHPSQIKLIGALGTALLLAWITYSFVEKPWRYGGNPRRKAAILVSIIIVIGSLGLINLTKGGFPDRHLLWTDFTLQQFDYRAAYRGKKCLLNGKERLQFSDICDGELIGKPTVVLWGDSHSASLYRGFLKQSHKLGFNLAQYSISGCPPAIDFDIDQRQECKWLNTSILEKIRTTKPDTVVLSANWMLYDGHQTTNGALWNYLPDGKIVTTLHLLQSLGIKNIIVMGQLPSFQQSQMIVGAKFFIPGLNNRTYSYYIHESNVEDDRMRKIASDNEVSFVSPIDTLCNDTGCLISTSMQKFTPLSWDSSHLTTDGAEFFIQSAINNNALILPQSN